MMAAPFFLVPGLAWLAFLWPIRGWQPALAAPILLLSLGVYLIATAVRGWRRNLHLLQYGAIAEADFLALHRSRSVYRPRQLWRYESWKSRRPNRGEIVKTLQKLRRERKRGQSPRESGGDKMNWNGVGSCLFRFQLPDGTTVLGAGAIDLEERLAIGDDSTKGFVVYDPKMPEHSMLFERFNPPIAESPHGDWTLEASDVLESE